MKPEEFDHRLNQKLDELHPVFEERDWNRFYAKYQSQSQVGAKYSSKKKYLLLLLLLFFTLGVAYQMNAFQWVQGLWNRQNAISNPVMATTKIPTSKPLTTKDLSGTSQAELPTKNGVADAVHSIANSNSDSKVNESIQKHSNASSTIFNSTETLNKNKNIKSEQNSNKLAFTHAINNQSFTTNNSAEFATSLNKGEPNSELNAETIILENPKQTTEELLFMENLDAGPLAIDFKPDLNAKFIEAIHSFKYSIGALTLLTEKHFNQGIAFELKTKKYISFSTGLIRQAYFEQAYSDTYSFSETTADEFSDLIKPRHSRSENIRNIRINSREWLLPLQLKYYLPFSSKYAAYFSGGIQLTLSSRVSMDFEYLSYVTQQVMSENDFDQASNRSTLINQFNLGSGIQRSFNKLNCQLGISLQKNNSNQSFISKYEPAVQFGLFYKI